MQRFFNQLLTAEEIAYATEIGRRRSAANDAYSDGIIDQRREPEEIDIQGAIAELAFAKYYGLSWTGRLWTRGEWEERRTDGDIGSIQIKSACRLHHRLVIPAKHKHLLNYPYVLVSLHALPIAVLAGWCMGTYAIRDRFWNKTLPKHAWAVPRSALAPMETFNPALFSIAQQPQQGIAASVMTANTLSAAILNTRGTP